MERFQFPLEKALRWRSVQLVAEQSRLKTLLEQHLRLQAARAELGAEKSNLSSSLMSFADLRGGDLQAASVYSLRLRRQAEKLAAQLAECEKDIRIQTRKYQDAKRRVQLLEDLKERKLAEWQYSNARELETLASESYLAKWNRDQGQNP